MKMEMSLKRVVSIAGVTLILLLVLSACGKASTRDQETRVLPATGQEQDPIAVGSARPGSGLLYDLLRHWFSSNTSFRFEIGNAHTAEGMRHLVNATEYSRTGDQERAQEELNLSESEFGEAARMFETVLGIDPEHTAAMVNLGAVYYSLGQLDKAINQYQQALELEPNDAGIHSNLAAAFFQKNDMSRALTEYQLAVELDPTLAEAHFGLGVTYMLLERPDEAILAFETFQALDDGEDPIASQQAAEYLQQLGEK